MKHPNKQTIVGRYDMRAAYTLTLSLILFLSNAPFSELRAQPTFRRVANSTTPIPAGTGEFTSFGNTASIHNGNVVFRGGGEDGQQGIYFWQNGVITRIADASTQVPNGSGTFAFLSFFAYTVRDGNILFHGAGTNGENGLYQWKNQNLSKWIDHTDLVPGNGGNFTSFRLPFQTQDTVSFIGYGENDHSGVYTKTESGISKIVDSNDPYPGGTGTLGFSSEAPMEDDTIAFWAFDRGQAGMNGIFVFAEGKITKLAEVGSTAPGTGQTFSSLNSPPAIDDGKVYFTGRLEDASNAIFRSSVDGSNLELVHGQNVSIPGGTGNFTDYGSFSASDGILRFSGNGNSNPIAGLYKNSGGSVSKLVDLNDLLDERPLQQSQSALRITPQSVHNNELAFVASFEDGTQGVYTTSTGSTSPTPPIEPPIAPPTAVPPPILAELDSSTITISPSGEFSIQFTGVTGTTYQFQYVENLNSKNWTQLIEFIYSIPVALNDPGAANSPFRFYRITQK